MNEQVAVLATHPRSWARPGGREREEGYVERRRLTASGVQRHKGNFEVLGSRTGGGFLQFSRDNDTPGFPWSGPGLAMGSEDDVTDVVLVQDSRGRTQLASVRREGRSLQFTRAVM